MSDGAPASFTWSSSSSGQPPRTAGLVVDGAAATSWQTSGHRVGRFARALLPEEVAALVAAADSAAREPARGTGAPFESLHGSTESVRADGVELAPDSAAAALLRDLHADLAASPVGALELAVGVDPATATLRHVGAEPLDVRVSRPTVQTLVYDADSRVVSELSAVVDLTVDEAVGPGWTVALPGEVPATPDGGFVSVTVGPIAADALGDGVLRQVELGWSDGWDDEEVLT